MTPHPTPERIEPKEMCAVCRTTTPCACAGHNIDEPERIDVEQPFSGAPKSIFDVRSYDARSPGDWNDDVPREVQQELMQCALATSVSLDYLCAIYRKGAAALAAQTHAPLNDENEKTFARSDQPQLRACEADPRGDQPGDSLLDDEGCPTCGGTGELAHDCGEDTCCCLDKDGPMCPTCGGMGCTG